MNAVAVLRCLTTWWEWRYPHCDRTHLPAMAQSLSVTYTDTEVDELMDMWAARNSNPPTAALLADMRAGRLDDIEPMTATEALARSRAALAAAKATREDRYQALRTQPRTPNRRTA